MGLITAPEVWLINFLKDSNIVNIADEGETPEGLKEVWMLQQVQVDGRLVGLPSIVFTPTYENTLETFQGSKRMALGFTCDCRAETYELAQSIRNQAITALNNRVLNQRRVFRNAEVSYAEPLDFAQTGTAPIMSAAFDVAIRR